MSKFTIIGIVSFVAGVLLLGFQSISAVMGTEVEWEEVALVDVVAAQHLHWIDGMSWSSLQSAADYVVTMPLFLLLFAFGAIFFVLHIIWGK